MYFRDYVLSEKDYEQLPPALQRKYFSTLERLRFAHDAHPSNTRSRFQSSRRPSTSHSLTARSQSLPCVDQHNSSTRTRLRKASRSHPTISLPLTPHDFAALPPVIQRKYFSLEEQSLIANRSTPIVLDAADEALRKRYLTRQHSTVPYWLFCVREDGQDWQNYDSDMERIEGMDLKDLESFRWLDENHDLDLKLDDYHAISQQISTTRLSHTSVHKRSFRRGLSFSNMSMRRRSSSSMSMPVASTQTNGPAPSAISPLISPQPKHQSRDSVASLDPAATHYQDPAAKMKLRVYLASPQKFDEALEFGFPSLHHDTAPLTGRPQTSPGTGSGQVKTFFSDDTPSLSEDDHDDGTSLHPGQESPTTPIEMSFPGQKLPPKPNVDRASHFRPRIVTESYAYGSATEREMTLKMTLTRPELRNIEMDHNNSIDVNDRPLEKAPLTVSFGGSQSIWDDLPEQPSRVKRFLQKFKGKA